MIVRILNEGQWELSEDAVRDLNHLDDAVEHAVSSGDAEELSAALHSLLSQVRQSGSRLSDDDLHDSDLILPDADSSLEEVRQLLDESDEGLVPN